MTAAAAVVAAALWVFLSFQVFQVSLSPLWFLVPLLNLMALNLVVVLVLWVEVPIPFRVMGTSTTHLGVGVGPTLPGYDRPHFTHVGP